MTPFRLTEDILVELTVLSQLPKSRLDMFAVIGFFLAKCFWPHEE